MEANEKHSCLTRRVQGAARIWNVLGVVRRLKPFYPEQIIRRVFWRVVSTGPEV